MYINNPNNFPIDSLPPILRNVVLELQTNTRFPLPMIFSSELGTVAAICQNLIDVELPMGNRSPVSLFILLIADSGEGKSPTDRLLSKPIRDFEEKHGKNLERLNIRQKARKNSWEIELKAIQGTIRTKIKQKILAPNDPEQIDLLNIELEELEQALGNHYYNEPRLQPQYKIIHSNITPGKIIYDLSVNVPTAYISSDEGGSLFRSAAMRDLGMWNQGWEGSPLQYERLSLPSFEVKNPRISLFVAVQGKVLDKFLNGRGEEARGIGFLARCLVTFPYSTKGTRMLGDRPQFSQYLDSFHQRCTDILLQDQRELDQGREDKLVLKFSEESKLYWYEFRNRVEFDLNPGRYLSDIDDFASKITTNLARIAALFHFFEGQEGDISLATISQAGAICEWYIHEFKRLFSSSPEIPQEVADTFELEQFLRDWCIKHQGSQFMSKSLVVQYGPNRLRGPSSKVRRAYAIDQLVAQSKILLVWQGKKCFIQLNPQFFPVGNPIRPY